MLGRKNLRLAVKCPKAERMLKACLLLSSSRTGRLAILSATGRRSETGTSQPMRLLVALPAARPSRTTHIAVHDGLVESPLLLRTRGAATSVWTALGLTGPPGRRAVCPAEGVQSVP